MFAKHDTDEGRCGHGPRRRHNRHRGFRGGPDGVSARSASASAPAVRGRARAQGAPRRHPHGRAAAARRGAAQRLPDHAGGRGAQRRRLAPEPRLGIPGAAAARGRGPDPLEEIDGRKLFGLTDAGRAQLEDRARGRARAVGADERRRQRRGARVRRADARGRLRVRQVMRTGCEAQIGRGPQGARHGAPRPLPDPRRRRARSRPRARTERLAARSHLARRERLGGELRAVGAVRLSRRRAASPRCRRAGCRFSARSVSGCRTPRRGARPDPAR